MRFLDENWTFAKVEIDLIAINQTIIFCEVKAPGQLFCGEPEEFVDNRKQNY
jgi:Holliday junction resolvase-like predicted endonuclease